MCAEVIDVLHHQAPGRQARTSGCAFEQFDEESFRVVGEVAGKLTYLIGGAHVCVFVCDGEDVIYLQGAGEADVAQGIVDGIFCAGEFACSLQLLVVDAAVEAVSASYTVQDNGGL